MANRCLCCQLLLDEKEGRHHARCLKALWGKPIVPKIPFAMADLPEKVTSAEDHMSISGVQAKVLVRLNKETSDIEIAPSGSTHILKPEPNEYPGLPQLETACMSMASVLGMPVPPHGLFPMSDGHLCYVVKRFDRTDDGGKIQKETMFQLLEATDKYSGSLESVGKTIRAHVENVGLDTIDFFERVLFCFLTGNGDMHLKNWALLITDKEVSLSPCYDFVSSKVYFANEEDSALMMNAKKNKLKRSDFEAFANSLRIDPKAAANVFEKMKGAQEKMREMCIDSELNPSMRKKFEDAMTSRFKRLYI